MEGKSEGKKNLARFAGLKVRFVALPGRETKKGEMKGDCKAKERETGWIRVDGHLSNSKCTQ